MKRIISIALCLALVFSTAATVSAAGSVGPIRSSGTIFYPDESRIIELSPSRAAVYDVYDIDFSRIPGAGN